MMFAFSASNLINQYSLYAIPMIVLIAGLLISKFTIGVKK